MRNWRVVVVGIALVSLALTIIVHAQSPAPPGAAVVEFKTMLPVHGPFVGRTNPIQGVPGGGLPWVIADGRGTLMAGGNLEIFVKGLVLADDPSVPENLRLTNPVPAFRGMVSCRIINGGGSPDFVNVSTDPFAADSAGNSHISAIVELPSECFAPIIFVTSPTGSWFAISGR